MVVAVVVVLNCIGVVFVAGDDGDDVRLQLFDEMIQNEGFR